jgi:hypothetical protein
MVISPKFLKTPSREVTNRTGSCSTNSRARALVDVTDNQSSPKPNSHSVCRGRLPVSRRFSVMLRGCLILGPPFGSQIQPFQSTFLFSTNLEKYACKHSGLQKFNNPSSLIAVIAGAPLTLSFSTASARFIQSERGGSSCSAPQASQTNVTFFIPFHLTPQKGNILLWIEPYI